MRNTAAPKRVIVVRLAMTAILAKDVRMASANQGSHAMLRNRALQAHNQTNKIIPGNNLTVVSSAAISMATRVVRLVMLLNRLGLAASVLGKAMD
jgi:hypothetical protein